MEMSNKLVDIEELNKLSPDSFIKKNLAIASLTNDKDMHSAFSKNSGYYYYAYEQAINDVRAMLEAAPKVEVEPVGEVMGTKYDKFLGVINPDNWKFLNVGAKFYTSPPDTEAKLTTLLTAVENYIAPSNSYLEMVDRLQELKRLHAEFTK
jgi:hypothetical protein